ncbi:MAG: DUF192 domain-containing protein [Hyphomicrobiales bacterium]
MSASALAQDMPQVQIELKTSTGTHMFTTEVASTNETRAKGLMFREKMAPDHGMLFTYNTPRSITMWMKNTPLSLDMIFIRASGQVATIAPNTVPFSLDYITSGEDVSYVLEVIAGTAERIGLEPGDQVSIKR